VLIVHFIRFQLLNSYGRMLTRFYGVGVRSLVLDLVGVHIFFRFFVAGAARGRGGAVLTHLLFAK
jgi:hypothetical protein